MITNNLNIFLIVFTACFLGFQNLNAQNNRPNLDNDSIRYYVLQKVNEHRKQNGRSNLLTNSLLNEAASLHCKYMSLEKKLTHEQENKYNHYYRGTLPTDRVGYSAGENALYNWVDETYTSEEIAEILFDQWRQSPGHNENMLYSWQYMGFDCFIGTESSPVNPDKRLYKHIKYKIYAVQVFTWE